MTTVTGEMAVLLDVLGYRQGDDRILKAIALVGPDMVVEEFDFDGDKSTYFTFKPAGTDLLFEDNTLVSIMVRTQPDTQDATYGLYPRPAALVDGLSPPQPAPKSQQSWAIRNVSDRISADTRSTTVICISSLIRTAESPKSPHYLNRSE